MKKIAIPVAVLAFSLLLTNLAPASDANEPKQTIKRFFEAVAKNDVDGALKTLFNGAQLTSDAERELSTGITKALSYYGTPHRFDLVSESPKGPVVVKFIYTQSFDTLPLGWSFFAYQNSHGWVIISAQFSDKTDLLQ